ncbi:GGDEF domain-containing protein [Novosphingobium sp. 9]|uniref:GGDEF domain-containing protein n=1 Tax=Novosphingobium sp. 9 TaxID=2025349 RepID=UPI0021B5F0C4|nr:GGDEF domain-containing protein [Novosphingobium sp. 9]
MPDITTIVACSTALSFIMGLAIVLAWIKDGRPAQRTWLSVPFTIAIPAGVLLGYPDVMQPLWAIRIGWLLILLVYVSAWQAARVSAGRSPVLVLPLLACFGCFAFSLTFASHTDPTQMFSMMPRIALMAAFNALIAREFKRMRAPELPSANILYGIFATFAMIDVLRLPFSLSLPAPLGPLPPTAPTIIFFNLEIVIEGMLLGLFMTALGREQLAAQHLRLAQVDPLTGIGNRRALDAHMAGLPSCRTGKVRAMVALDIDHFKTINDRYGHAFGDRVIIGAAEAARSIFGSDCVFRIGGEEFLAVLDADDHVAVFTQAERMRHAFAAMRHHLDDTHDSATMSLGIALFEHPGDEERWDAVLTRADEALYEAKRAGRNRTMTAGLLPSVDDLPPSASALAPSEKNAPVPIDLARKRRLAQL